MVGDASDETSCSAYQAGKCDFEHGLCLYSQSSDDRFDWTVSTSGTFSYGTGPTVDHTTQSNKGIMLLAVPSSVNLSGMCLLTRPRPFAV